MSILFVISAPSGTGKSTILRDARRTDPRLTFSRSYTTRAPRGPELDGVDYYFTSKEDFEHRAAQGEFLEYANVFGNYYGTHKSEIDRAAAAGCDLVMDIDVQGARQLRERVPDAVLIFVLPPDRSELERRLRARSQDQPEVIERRLREAKAETSQYGIYDYILINDELDAAVADLRSIIRAERLRRHRMEDPVQRVLGSF
jgi:guanylate kinase